MISHKARIRMAASVTPCCIIPANGHADHMRCHVLANAILSNLHSNHSAIMSNNPQSYVCVTYYCRSVLYMSMESVLPIEKTIFYVDVERQRQLS